MLGRRGGPVGFSIAGIVAILIFIRFVFPGFFITLVSPVWAVGTFFSTTTHNMTAGYENTQQLVKERDAAVAQTTVLENQNQVLAAKVSDLTKLLGDRVEAPKGVVAAVWARPPVAPYDTLVVDQGTAAGVIPHDPVYGPGGIPVGTVDSVTQWSARISLYSSSGQTTSALVGATRIPITLQGAGAGAFDAQASRTSAIVVGDSVFVGGPGSLPIGTIISIDSDPASPNEVLHIRPLVQPFSLTSVIISPLP